MRRATIFALLIFSSISAYSQEPNITGAAFDEYTNVLTISFDAPVWATPDKFVFSGLTFDDDNGGNNPDVTLPGGEILNTTSTATDLEILLPYLGYVGDYTDEDGNLFYLWGTNFSALNSLEAMDHSSIEMTVREMTYLGANNYSNPEIGPLQAIPLNYIPSSDIPQLNYAEYSASSNRLKLVFSHTMQWDTGYEDRMYVWIDGLGVEHRESGNGILDAGEDLNGNGVLDREQNIVLLNITISDGTDEVTLNGGDMVNTTDNDTLEMELLFDNYKAIESLETDSLSISFSAFTFLDDDYNTVPAVTSPVTFIPDSNPMTADSANYNAGTNELKVYFNNSVGSGYAQIPKLSFHIAGQEVILQSGPNVTAPGNYIKFTLLLGDQMDLEMLRMSFPDSALVMEVESYAVLDTDGNGNLETLNVPVTFVPESGSNRAPLVQSVVYEAENNKLAVTFDVNIKQTAEEVDISKFSFLSGSDTLTFSTDQLGASGNNKILWLILNQQDEMAVEGAVEKDSLLLLLEPFAVLQSPKLNGNWVVTADSLKYVTYIYDTTSPLPELVKYNDSEEMLIVRFSEAMADTVDFTKLHFGGLTFTGGAVEYGEDPSWLHLNLTSADRSAITNLPDNVKVNIQVVMETGAFNNFDGLSNDSLSFYDNETLTSGSESVVVLVGLGHDFWLISKERFPTLPRLIPATIRSMGEHCVIYVADDQWQPYLTVDMFGDIINTNNNLIPIEPSEVTAVFNHFEGIDSSYNRINQLFATGKENLVPEVVNILICDIRDEYALGRNESQTSYWIGSFFNPDDQFSEYQSGGDFVTNEMDLIYLDSWPQFYSDQDSCYWWNRSLSTPIWVLNTTPAFPVTAFNALDNAYTKLLCYKVDPWESQWMVEGFASLAELLIDGEASFYGASSLTTPTKNALKVFDTGLFNRSDFFHAYFFVLYLYEKYGGEELIKKLAVQPAVDMNALEAAFQQLLEEDAGDSILQARWTNDDAKDVFSNYAMACLLDTSNMSFVVSDPTIDPDNYMFNFENINLQGSVGLPKNPTFLSWNATDPPPYYMNQEEWSFSYYCTTFSPPGSVNPLIAATLELGETVAMVDTMTIKLLVPYSEINFFQLCLKNGAFATTNPHYYFKYFPYDTVSKMVSFKLSPDPAWTFYHFEEEASGGVTAVGDYNTLVIVGVLGGEGKVTQEAVPPSLTHLSVAQSPLVSSRFDIYLMVSDLVWGGQTNAESDIPKIRYILGNDTTETDMVAYNFLLPFGLEDTYSFYSTFLNLTTPGNYRLYAYFTDLAGEEYNLYPDSTVAPYQFVVEYYNPASGALMNLGGAEFRLEANSYPSALDLNLKTVNLNAPSGAENNYLYALTYFSAPPVEPRQPIGPAYQLTPEVTLSEPVWMALPYDDYIRTHSPGELGVYYYDGNGWIYIGGTPDPSTQTIKVRSWKLGLFQIQAGPHGAVPAELQVPDRYALEPNYPNPFNPTTKINYQLSRAGYTRLTIYDIQGREIKTLVNGFQNTGDYSVTWDGRSEEGVPVASGVYMFRLKSGKFDKSNKMILLK